jgi:AbrB family looped-hinge helix DNA binding protein
METTATTKGQIVIPIEIRRKLGITEGTRIRIEVDEEAKLIVLKPITRAAIARFRGVDKGKGILKALQADRAREKNR